MIFKNINILLKDGYHLLNVNFSEKINSLNNNKIAGIDYSNKMMIPGLFDIHTHGADGYDFNSAKTISDMQIILNYYMAHGVTSVLPTLLTDSDEVIKTQLEKIYQLSLNNPIIKGIHLEGPFLSEEFKGAQPKEYLQPLNINKFHEYQKCAHGLVKYITISPELENTASFVKELVNEGIVVSLGHSGATFDETTVAIKNGATNITHVMNAMKPIHQHAPSILSAALYYDDIYNELILDGIHVVPEMVQFLVKIKTSDKIIGITDSLMAAGLKDGNYFIGSTPIYVKDHDCKIVGSNVRAGSTLNAFDGFKNIKKFINCDDLVASTIWSKNASDLLHLSNLYGTIDVDKSSDFIIVDKDYNLLETYINGKCVYKKEK